MPELIAEMRDDLRGDETELIREFVVLASPQAAFWSEKARFSYFESQHPHLRLQIDWLEEMGVVVDVTPKTTPVYRIVAEFAAWLRGST